MEQVLLLHGLYKCGSYNLVLIVNLWGIILFYSRTGKAFSTGQLIANFHKGAIGKIQVTKTLKSKELGTSDSETLYYMLLVLLSLRLVNHRI